MHVHYALCTCGIYTKCIAPRRPPGLAGFLTPLGGRSSHGRAARPDLHGLPKRPSIRGRSLRPSWHASEYNHTSSRPLWRRCHECTLAISAHRRSHSSACVSWPGKLRSRADPCLDYQSAGCELAPRQSSNHAHAPPSLPYRWPNVPAREKGVDVMLAVYFVRAAIEKQADILILASRDTDYCQLSRWLLISEKQRSRPACGRTAAAFDYPDISSGAHISVEAITLQAKIDASTREASQRPKV
jgi:hypothetical protein